jgi:uronate dehydrogenase
MYWDKEGVEAVCLRILSCTEPVKNTRAVGSWLSYRDMVHLVERSVSTPVTGFLVAYGVSNNDRSPVDNSAAAVLGYRPQDNAEEFAKDLFASAPTPDPSDPAQMTHGGPFASVELGVSGVSMLKKMG